MGKAQQTESPSDRALTRVRATVHRFAGVEEKTSHGAPSFFVAGKMILTFVDNHHNDGLIAVWLKATPEKQRQLVAAAPDRYYVPPYVGVKGWVGARLDVPSADWVDLAILVEEAWLSVAPPKLQRGEGVRKGPPPPPPPRVTTDAKLAKETLERLTKMCLALPDAERERESSHASYTVGKKTFCYFLDNHHGDGMIVACVKNDREASARLVKKDPEHYAAPAYIGKMGWLGVRLDAKKVDWKGLEERVKASYAKVAPKRKVAAAKAPSPRKAAAKK